MSAQAARGSGALEESASRIGSRLQSQSCMTMNMGLRGRRMRRLVGSADLGCIVEKKSDLWAAEPLAPPMASACSPTLAESLTAEFGKGFDASNLRYMRLFYQAFPKCDAQRYELSWTHYRSLLRIDEFDLFFPRVSANSNLLIFV